MIGMQARRWRSRCALAVCLSLFMRSTVCAAQETHPGTVVRIADTTALLSPDEEGFRLSPNALQVARIIGVEPLITKLSALTGTKSPNTDPGTSFEELLLRQRINDFVVAASLDVDSVLNKIDYEREQTVELRTMLLSQRERASGSTNLAILAIGTGLGVIGSTLSFTEGTSKAADAVGIGAGALTALLWFRSYRQQRGGKRPAWVLPNMLAPFFSESEGPHSYYPTAIWTYLDSTPPAGTSEDSRREQLLAEWLAAGRIGPLDSPQSKQKIELLTSTDAADKNLHLDSLSERGAMLADVRDRVSSMNQDLRDLMQGLRPR